MEKKVKTVEVYKYIKANPGVSLRNIGTHFHLWHPYILPNIYELEVSGRIHRELRKNNTNMDSFYQYYAN